VIHNYRWRLGLAEGQPKYDDLAKRLAEGPVTSVPTITLEGDTNGAPYPDSSSYAKVGIGLGVWISSRRIFPPLNLYNSPHIFGSQEAPMLP
jgi:hypothetical protein